VGFRGRISRLRERISKYGKGMGVGRNYCSRNKIANFCGERDQNIFSSN